LAHFLTGGGPRLIRSASPRFAAAFIDVDGSHQLEARRGS
jgi:hypothetical protein